jgi:ADP-heptose:LPS heptosyltransferase
MKTSFEKIYDWVLPLILKFNTRGKGKVNGGIIIIALHKLGDAVFTIPAIRSIIKHHSGKRIFIVCFRETLPIFNLALNNIEYLILDKNNFYFGNRLSGFKARNIINNVNAERIYDITGCITSASLLYNCTAKEIFGMNELRYKPLYDVYSKISNGPHMSDIYLNALKPVMNILRDDKHANTIKHPDSGFILIHPFAGWKAKEWGLEKFMDLARKLSSDSEVRFNILRGYLPEHDFEVLNKEFKVEVTESIPDLIECIKKCSLFIGNDSGPVHIANLMKKPVFTIYGPTNPSYHQPKSGQTAFIQKEIICLPKVNEKLCFTDGGRNGCPSFECMIQLSVNEVYLSVTNFINKTNDVK